MGVSLSSPVARFLDTPVRWHILRSYTTDRERSKLESEEGSMRIVPRMGRCVVVGLGVAALVATAAAHTRAPQDSATGKTEAEVRRASDEEVQAFLRKDSKALARLWSDDFVVTNPLNQFVTKQQVLGMVDSGVLIITSFERQVEYLKVYGNTVIVVGRESVIWGGKMPNAGRSESLRFTAIWMKQPERWQEVARHANVLPPR
jgi:ketosteroid isomerase-like protein